MKPGRQKTAQRGFSLIEMMIAAVIFVLLCGAAFALLSVAQQRYQTESQILNSFQEARFGLDDMVRDVNGSGYPSPSEYEFNPGPPANFYASTPVAWSSSAGYPNSPCQIGTGGGGSCVSSTGSTNTPGDFDVIIERDPNPSQNLGVQWIRYQLSNNTLLRAQVPKTAGGDPDSLTAAAFVPYVQNVMNNTSTAQIGQFQAVYPQMFPGGQAVPVFSYTCYTPGGTQPCISAGSYNSPAYVTDVEITLIVMAPTVDAQTGVPRLIELQGRGHSINSTP
jgi:prepilin-type N-terminal cleavage/methylation domain-containing protein